MKPPHDDPESVSLALHDPLCVFYTMLNPDVLSVRQTEKDHPGWSLHARSPEDIRVETSGQWTRGMCVVDRRSRRKLPEVDTLADLTENASGGVENASDNGGWLNPKKGNRVRRCTSTGWEHGRFAEELLRRIFG